LSRCDRPTASIRGPAARITPLRQLGWPSKTAARRRAFAAPDEADLRTHFSTNLIAQRQKNGTLRANQHSFQALDLEGFRRLIRASQSDDQVVISRWKQYV